MNDPYRVLGVSPTASNEEIKKAYRELAKKYHPDNYADSPIADIAEDKMKEINDAYDEILKIRAGRGESTNYSSSGYEQNNGSYSTSTNDPYYYEVRKNINNGKIRDAEAFLNSVPSEKRNAEWCFLMACVLTKKGYYFDALRMADTACNMAPDNREFAALRDNLRRQSQGYAQQNQQRNAGGCNMCDICSLLICLDCLCR
ncbi:MAG: DnaJ domain-containing protein [Clostridia bacterium]|nr:DnaJ domain-containing protein [Clostridia bacterium]